MSLISRQLKKVNLFKLVWVLMVVTMILSLFLAPFLVLVTGDTNLALLGF